ncbi:hypothetical protein M8J76_017045 [Diaphorina citri]|nr:hypothetical protein M8J76_017045 [Diaphorina citri]
MKPTSPLNLLVTCIIILTIVTSQNKVSCKTTLSKLQYINAIRDIIEGLIKSLATRQRHEFNKRLELQEYRKHYQHRLGKDILVCRLCREIFTDPDKYFDHAHFHVVERLSLAATTNVNLPCKLCEASFNNKYDYYKHCYEAHLEQNLDKLTTTPATSTTMRPNYDSDLYCKICNITLLYPEKFYVHSFQHLQDNMDFIMNKTTLQQIDGTTESIVDEKTCTQRMDTELPSQEEGIRRKRSVQEDGANRETKTYDLLDTIGTDVDTHRINRARRQLTTSQYVTKANEESKGTKNDGVTQVVTHGSGETKDQRTSNWTNLYPTVSRIIERFHQTQVRVVRITKDLRTTKKVTLKPYTGDEEFTGDAFEGESGEMRYERMLKKMRKNKIYLKCPHCPLRFLFHPEMMSHINKQHNISSHLGENTFHVPFKTFAPGRGRFANVTLPDFENNFPTFPDYEYKPRTTTSSAQTGQHSTTFNMEAISEMMAKFMKPEYMQGFLTTSHSTRNIDYLHRARTYATTMPPLSNLHEALGNVREYLRKMASTLMSGQDMTDSDEDPTTGTTVTEAPKSEAAKDTTRGVVIEEITTQKFKEIIEKDLKECDEELKKLKDMEKELSTDKLWTTTYSRDGTDRKDTTEQLKITRTDVEAKVFTDDGGKIGIVEKDQFTRSQTGSSDGVFANGEKQFANKTTEDSICHPEVKSTSRVCFDRYNTPTRPPRPRKIKWTTQEYKLLYGTELNVTVNEQVGALLEILRRTRPVENYYRHIFDYKRRLGPTEMSYEDSQDEKSTTPAAATPLTPTPDQEALREELYEKFIESLNRLTTNQRTKYATLNQDEKMATITPTMKTDKDSLPTTMLQTNQPEMLNQQHKSMPTVETDQKSLPTTTMLLTNQPETTLNQDASTTTMQPTKELSEYEKFLRKLSDLKAEEQRRKAKARADYEDKLKRAEAEIDEANTPMMINVNELHNFRCEDEEKNKRVAEAHKYILKNNIRETIWNSTGAQPGSPERTYDYDAYGSLEYETRTQYVYDPTNHGVFKNDPPPTLTKIRVTYTPSV